MSLFEEVKSLLDKLEGTPMIEYQECAYYLTEGELYYNKDSNLEELYEGNGSTYSLELKGSTFTQDGCLFANGDGGCGETYTIVFPDNLEVSYEDLEEMFGEQGE